MKLSCGFGQMQDQRQHHKPGYRDQGDGPHRRKDRLAESDQRTAKTPVPQGIKKTLKGKSGYAGCDDKIKKAKGKTEDHVSQSLPGVGFNDQGPELLTPGQIPLQEQGPARHAEAEQRLDDPPFYEGYPADGKKKQAGHRKADDQYQCKKRDGRPQKRPHPEYAAGNSLSLIHISEPTRPY